MCGITGGIWNRPERAIDSAVLERMVATLRHRGPDDQGTYRSEYRVRPPYDAQPGVALGFRRLSIIDLAGGHQPLANEDESIWLVFNGEIYNFPDLRRRLEGAGHTFRTESDSETIVHLYEDEGVDCFQHLNGMFAIAIWDSRRRQLVLGRDRLGQKPLVYCHQPGRLLFASELKSLLQVPDVSRDLDPNSLDEYLTFQYVPHPNTIFRAIRKLPPGHRLVFRDDQVRVEPYWQVDFARESHPPASQQRATLEELFDSSVTLRMRSDVPLGAFLSGGVDSSLTVALMQRRAAHPIKTFSIGFPVAEYDETAYARQVAQHLGTEHREFQVTPDCVDVIHRLAYHYDEPFADSSAIPTWYVSQYTREHVTVALSGDGGDELFAGYPRYRAVALSGGLDRLPAIRGLLSLPLWQRLPASPRQKSLVRRLKRFSQGLAMPPARRYLEWIEIFHELQRASLYTAGMLEQLTDSDPFALIQANWARAKGRDAVTAASLTDLVTYLPCDLMTKVDIASMAHGLEVRQPFLDYRLVEFAACLPIRSKYRRGRGKRLLRETFGDLLPAAIWTRKKMGFGVPLDHWFRHELRTLTEDLLLDDRARERGYFQPAAVRQLISDHQQGRFDHSARLWALLMFELWARQWVDASPPTAAPHP